MAMRCAAALVEEDVPDPPVALRLGQSLNEWSFAPQMKHPENPGLEAGLVRFPFPFAGLEDWRAKTGLDPPTLPFLLPFPFPTPLLLKKPRFFPFWYMASLASRNVRTLASNVV